MIKLDLWDIVNAREPKEQDLVESLNMAIKSDVDAFAGVIRSPLLVKTDDPLESDVDFRRRLLLAGVKGDQVHLALGSELDAIGQIYCMTRLGQRRG